MFPQRQILRTAAFQILRGSFFSCTYTVYNGFFISQCELYTDFSGRIAILFADMHKKQPPGAKSCHSRANSAISALPFCFCSSAPVLLLPLLPLLKAMRGDAQPCQKKKQAHPFVDSPALTHRLYSSSRKAHKRVFTHHRVMPVVTFHQNSGSFFSGAQSA